MIDVPRLLLHLLTCYSRKDLGRLLNEEEALVVELLAFRKLLDFFIFRSGSFFFLSDLLVFVFLSFLDFLEDFLDRFSLISDNVK